MPNNQQQQQPREQGVPKKAIRVLSIDGGGIRGIAVAKILSRIEKQSQKRIHELFDVIVGTSTGGLLSVLLTVEVPAVPAIPEGISEKEREKLQKKQKRQREIRKELGLKDNEVRVLTASEIKKLYELRAKDIFHEDANFIHKLLDKNYYLEKAMHFFHSKYEKGVNLKQIVKALYIKNGFEQARTCTGVVVTERGFGMPLLLNSTNAKVQGRHNYHNTLSLAKLVRATSAAPTYFKAVHVHNPCVTKHDGNKKSEDVVKKEQKLIEQTSSLWDKELIDHKFCQRQTLFFEDGGVTCNNPSMKGFRYAKELLKLHGQNHSEYEFQIYSLGTGAEDYDQIDPAHEIITKLEENGEKEDSGIWKTLCRLVGQDPFDINRMSYKNHLKIQQRLKFFGKKTGIQHKYFRLQFKLNKDELEKMDDSSHKNMERLISSAQECMTDNPVFTDILHCLKEEVKRPQGLNKVMPNIKPDESRLFQCAFGLATKNSVTCELTSQAI